MPVTVKLSEAFYKSLGHDVADEMVEWFNQMDAANHASLREFNELNFARFEAKMDQRFAEFSVVLQEFARGIDRQLAEMRLEIKDLALSLKEQQVVHIRWMIGMWMVVLVAVMGLWIRR